ncbi:MAG TPA: hypothetical protein PKD20_00660 [Candidatus Saccharibacteria bacterium]|jgi:hypothetical protein|nr:hypothetical protein [Candidatus Saccharibacteria bacterium]HMT55367.1 hypothetical protein [Candidatus Saccharibacteria bacterium]
MNQADKKLEREGEWQREIHVASQWTEGRGWLRFHIGFPDRTEALMQSLAGLHEVVVWEQDVLNTRLAEQFGEGVDSLKAIKVTIATLDAIHPEWRQSEMAEVEIAESASTINFVDYLLTKKEQLPFDAEGIS